MKRRTAIFAAIFAAAALAGCSPKSIYYLPNAVLYQDPKALGLSYDLVQFESLNGNKLYGIYLRSSGPARGVVVHFHGNFGNVSNHFQLAAFLLDRGFDVFAFDYQGFGGSEGRPTPERTVQDGQAAVRYVLERTSGALPVGVFGQSIGAAAACVAAAREPEVDAVLLEGGFSAYRAILKDVMRRSWLLKPLSYFLPWMIAQRGLDPLAHVAELAPRPVFILHGTDDKTIPAWMAQALYVMAREPKKLWLAEGVGHLDGRSKIGKKYEEEVAGFFEAAFRGSITEIKTP